jgi:hypothetical protein
VEKDDDDDDKMKKSDAETDFDYDSSLAKLFGRLLYVTGILSGIFVSMLSL